MLSEEKRKLCAQLKRIIPMLEEAKLLYKERDRLTELLKDEDPSLLMKEGLLLKDNFAKKNTAWKQCAISRWEFEVVQVEE